MLFYLCTVATPTSAHTDTYWEMWAGTSAQQAGAAVNCCPGATEGKKKPKRKKKKKKKEFQIKHKTYTTNKCPEVLKTELRFSDSWRDTPPHGVKNAWVTLPTVEHTLHSVVIIGLGDWPAATAASLTRTLPELLTCQTLHHAPPWCTGGGWWDH